MMNNNDLFIKYEQGLLNEIDKAKFERELETSVELKNDFSLYKAKINFLSKGVEVNEQYLTNLIPNARNRIKKEKTFTLFPKIVYGIPVLILLIILTFSLIEKNNNKFEYNFDEWFTSFLNDEEIMENLFINVLSTEDDFLLVENNFTEINEDELDDLLFNEIKNSSSENYLNNDIVDEEFIQQFSPEQLDEVYSVLINKNIL
ncbi:MAG: hypothetical protein V3V16_11225 [Melioribacteraceae bacterium]